MPQDLVVAKQEKVFALIRDFIEGATGSFEFRVALKDMGIGTKICSTVDICSYFIKR